MAPGSLQSSVLLPYNPVVSVLDARALLDLSRGTALKIFSENVYENENSEKLIISDKEDIEKVGDVGKEIGREALGNVYDDKIDVTVNILYLENLKLVIELGIYEFLFTFLPKSDPNQRHIEYIF